MKYTRVYTDDMGESHFEDLDMEFNPVDFAPPAPPLNLTAFSPAKQYAFLHAPVGWYGDWHPAPARQLVIYLAGEVKAETSNGEIRRFGPEVSLWQKILSAVDTAAGSQAIPMSWRSS